MGLELARAMVMVRADASQLRGDFNAVKGTVASALGGLAGTIAGIGAAAVGAIGLGSLMSVVHESIDAAMEAEDAERRLAATIKATGGAAGFSAEQLKEMAGGFQKVTTFGDEAIMGGMSKLLTFRKVTGDVFKKTTELALDLAASGFGSIESASVMMGKALEDPVRGINALRRVGVSFDDTQKKQIKNFVDSGQLLKAQEVILAGVAIQVGGVAREMAKTDTGKIRQMTEAIGDQKEIIGGALLPIVRDWTEAKLHVWEAISLVTKGLVNMIGPDLIASISQSAVAVAGVSTAIYGAGIAWQFFGMTARKALIGTGIGVALIAVGVAVNYLIDKFNESGGVMGILGANAAKFAEAWNRIKTTFANVGAALSGVFTKLLNWISSLIGFDLGSAFDSMTTGFADFVLTATGFLQVLTENWGATWNLIKTTAAVAFSVVYDIFSNVFTSIYKVITSLPGIAIATFNSFVSVAVTAIAAIGDAFPYLVTIGIATFQSLLVGLMQYVRTSNTMWGGIFDVIFEVFRQIPTLATAAFNAVIAGFESLAENLARFPEILQAAVTGGNVAAIIADMTANVSDEISRAFEESGGLGAAGAVANTAKQAIDSTLGEAVRIPSEMAAAFESAGGGQAIAGLGESLVQNFQDAIGLIQKQFEGVLPEDLSIFGISPETKSLIDSLTGQFGDLMGMVPGMPGAVPGGPGGLAAVAGAGLGEAGGVGDLMGKRFGLAEFGTKLQEQIMGKGNVQERILAENVKQTAELRKTNSKVGGHTDRSLAGLADENIGAIQGGFGFGM